MKRVAHWFSKLRENRRAGWSGVALGIVAIVLCELPIILALLGLGGLGTLSTWGVTMPINEWIGLLALIVMVGSYALENVHPGFIALFALGCALAAAYAWSISAWPFFIAESVWSVIALRRWTVQRRALAAR